jgi:hypothetical protein
MRQDTITIRLELPEFRVQRVKEGEKLLEVWVEEVSSHEACPDCQWLSNRCHSFRWAEVWDRPIWDKGMGLGVHIRRFECVNPACWRCRHSRPFAERYASFGRGQHRTYRLARYIYRLAACRRERFHSQKQSIYPCMRLFSGESLCFDAKILT